jgi:putative tricarboxylic transport membrane protein
MEVLSRIDRAALFVLLVSLAVAGILLVGAGSIAPPMFDPVGSAALPRACALALIVIGFSVVLQSVFCAPWTTTTANAPGFRTATLGMIALMALYLLAMEWNLGFVLPTVAFVAASVPLVSASWKAVPVGVAMAVALGFGADWLFTEVFFVDLPVMK